MPRPKRPPPAPLKEPRYPRRRTASASASASSPSPSPSPGGGAGRGGAAAGRCLDLSRAFGRCRALLDDLLRHDDGWVFEAPVDARALGLRDYYTVIADPMDLGTVLRRLERRRYAHPTAFAADVRLTFRNALSYNDPGDPVYESAAELSGIFEAGWASIQPDLPPPRPTDTERRVRFCDELPRLPVDAQRTVAGFLKERDACLLEKGEKVMANLSKVDTTALDELDRLVAQHCAARADMDAPMQMQDP